MQLLCWNAEQLIWNPVGQTNVASKQALTAGWLQLPAPLTYACGRRLFEREVELRAGSLVLRETRPVCDAFPEFSASHPAPDGRWLANSRTVGFWSDRSKALYTCTIYHETPFSDSEEEEEAGEEIESKGKPGTDRRAAEEDDPAPLCQSIEDGGLLVLDQRGRLFRATVVAPPTNHRLQVTYLAALYPFRPPAALLRSSQFLLTVDEAAVRCYDLASGTCLADTALPPGSQARVWTQHSGVLRKGLFTENSLVELKLPSLDELAGALAATAPAAAADLALRAGDERLALRVLLQGFRDGRSRAEKAELAARLRPLVETPAVLLGLLRDDPVLMAEALREMGAAPEPTTPAALYRATDLAAALAPALGEAAEVLARPPDLATVVTPPTAGLSLVELNSLSRGAMETLAQQEPGALLTALERELHDLASPLLLPRRQVTPGLSRPPHHPYFDLLCSLYYRVRPAALLPFVRRVVAARPGQPIVARALRALPLQRAGAPDAAVQARAALLLEARQAAAAVSQLLEHGLFDAALGVLADCAAAGEEVEHSEIFHALVAHCLHGHDLARLERVWPHIPRTYSLLELLRLLEVRAPPSPGLVAAPGHMAVRDLLTALRLANLT